MKKLLYCSYSCIPSNTANSVAVMKQCAALDKKCDLRIILTKPYGNVKDYAQVYNVQNLKMIRLPKFMLKVKEYPMILFVLIYVFLFRPDCIYSRDLLINDALSFWGIPSIYEMHQLEQENLIFNRYYQKVLNRVLKRRTQVKIVCISEELKKQCIKRGVPKECMTVLHSGVDLSNNRSTAREFSDNPLIMYTGSLQPGKGIEIILEMAEKSPDLKYVIVGGSKEYTYEIPNVKVIPWVNHSEVPKYLMQADILLLPVTNQRYQFFSPLKMFEYLAAEKIIIASDTESVSEILEPGYNALLAKSGDADSFLACVRKVCEDKELQKTIRDNTLRTAQKYTWDIRAERIIKLFDQY